MTRPRHFLELIRLISLFVFLAPFSASAQLQSGNLYTVTFDQQGQALAGVVLTLDNGGEPRVQVSDIQGRAQFVDLAPGDYSLRAELEGFSTLVEPRIVINVGRNTSIELTLNPAVSEVIEVGEASEPSDPGADSSEGTQ